MALPLSVSSFPDSIATPRQPPFNSDTHVAAPAKKRHRIKSLFGIQVPPAIPAPKPEQVGIKASPGRSTSVPKLVIDTSCLPTFLPSHGAHGVPTLHQRRLTSVPSLEQRFPQTGAETYDHSRWKPRSTKESIANLGLARSMTPDPQLAFDADDVVTTCSNSGWVEPPPLPPLPPLPPPSPRPESQVLILYDKPNRVTSLPRNHTPYNYNDASIMETPVDDMALDDESPPSPITFSHRISHYFAAGSAHVPISDLVVPPPEDSRESPQATILPRDTTPAPHTHMSIRSPSQLSIRAAMAIHPWMKVRPPPTPISIPSPTKISSFTPLKLIGWTRIFRKMRRRSSSEVANVPSKAPAPRPNTIQIGPHACDLVFGDDELLPPTPLQDHDQDDADVVTLKFTDPEEGTLSRITTHHAIGDVWEEKDVGEIISTLRTMKVSGKIRG
ncbi:hypothetical protein NLI96_g9507 [Meripilus lineatus]|uniref:Uncharacterized protein n=1 Tax=Meripilus lineatus TaxID=2056292 RepID=A0AAD5UVK3_9APHY|nr:hypothetical protein NLI96_g9507 [Physisporinus lineatus]